MGKISGYPLKQPLSTSDKIVIVDEESTPASTKSGLISDVVGLAVGYSVTSYGAKGDGTTDDSSAIQAAINACEAAGGGVVYFPPATYKIATGLTVTLANLTGAITFQMYGAVLSYTGSGDALIINSNIISSVEHADLAAHFNGLHINGTSSATSGIRLKATSCTFVDTILENFTSNTAGNAALILEADFTHWVEENRFDSLNILNTGNGIYFLSDEDSGGVASSCENNYFRDINIWLTIGGKGIYGKGLGATAVCQIARSTFDGVVVHVANVTNCTAFDLTALYCAGVVFFSPAVDCTGTVTGLKMFNYTFTTNQDVVTVIGATVFPLSDITTANFFYGGGKFIILGGNYPNNFDSGAWDTFTPSLSGVTVGNGTLNYAVYKVIGKTCHFRMKFTLGSTSAITGLISFNLPLQAATTYGDTNEQIESNVTFQDVGVNTFTGVCTWKTSTTAALRAYAVSGSYIVLYDTGALVPFTWASGHYFEVAGTYEIA